jgi:hypothetical protein
MSLRARRRSRQAFKADPLGQAEPVLQAVPDPAQDTSPTLDALLQTLAPVDPDPVPPPVPPRRPQTLYAVGRTCFCGTPTTGDACVAHRDLPAPPAETEHPWLSLVTEEPLTEPELRRLVTAIFSCDRCGARLGHDGLCDDYGTAHATPEQLAARASWGPSDVAGCTPVRRPHRGGAA